MATSSINSIPADLKIDQGRVCVETRTTTGKVFEILSKKNLQARLVTDPKYMKNHLPFPVFTSTYDVGQLDSRRCCVVFPDHSNLKKLLFSGFLASTCEEALARLQAMKNPPRAYIGPLWIQNCFRPITNRA